MRALMVTKLAVLTLCAASLTASFSSAFGDTAKHKILFFSKSSGFEHSAITWKNGK
ncbi:MAG: hypothetical protein JWO94_2229, partial [Verrucomicrobiaceae bacterium]|nr:hypothetical protein [Verrucomicrobiaceae bacterium]